MDEKPKRFELSVLPTGFCPECLQRMLTGRPYENPIALVGGSVLVQAYCAHNEAGATLVLKDGLPQQWRIMVPIDAVHWKAYVDRYAQLREGLNAARNAPAGPLH